MNTPQVRYQALILINAALAATLIVTIGASTVRRTDYKVADVTFPQHARVAGVTIIAVEPAAQQAITTTSTTKTSAKLVVLDTSHKGGVITADNNLYFYVGYD